MRLKAIVTEVNPYGTGVYQIRMRPESRIPCFKAGQFLHLTLDGFDPSSGFWPESRVFSIASGPDEECLQIVPPDRLEKRDGYFTLVSKGHMPRGDGERGFEEGKKAFLDDILLGL